MSKGKINSDVIPSSMCLKGWNALAFSAGKVAFNLRKAQKAAQKEKNYPLADFYRNLAVSLENSLEPLGIKYEEDENA